MPVPWIELASAAFGGGIVAKALDHLINEYRDRRKRKQGAREIVDKHLDPVLKAGDELVGKLRSLAQNDFKDLIGVSTAADQSLDDLMELGASCYLFSQLWARIQVLRMESLYVNLAATDSGKHLQKFVFMLESTGVRLIERARQRGIGEAIIDPSKPSRVLMFKEFLSVFRSDGELREWIAPLASQLSKTNHKSIRQRLLVYGAVVHAMIDCLDSEHLIVHDRPGWPNKLSRRSRRDLRFRIFGEYLPFVKNKAKYCGRYFN